MVPKTGVAMNRGELRPLTLDEIYEVLDSDWLYDLLPGNGEDDYILQRLRNAFDAKAHGRNCEAVQP